MMVAIFCREYGLKEIRFMDNRLMFLNDMIRSGKSIVLEIPYK